MTQKLSEISPPSRLQSHPTTATAPTMINLSAPSLMEGIRQGIEVVGRTLLEEARRTGHPLVTCRDGVVVLVDADGNLVPAEPEAKAASQSDE